MTDGWGTVIATVIPAAAGFIGIAVGRATTRDQATVEHKQWLRGQRQEAYVEFLAVWDRALGELVDKLDSLNRWDSLMDDWEGDPESAREDIYEAVAAIPARVKTPRERVLLLGPDGVDDLADNMLANITAMHTALLEHLNEELGLAAARVRFEEAHGRGLENRGEWLNRVKDVLRAAPKPT
ncbi:hypothetical protein [Streptomyces fulvoviolaceus]|uniref:hypothetical protein n=1 Tax=Streptomyces fulvoviolaceus TaxID=285535 RepID=UPI0004C9EF55|nr:hypothetical protein [Streptomyces fulvoviolaceus]